MQLRAVTSMRQRAGIVAGLLLLVLVASLVVYKSAGAIRQLERVSATGSLALEADVVSAGSAALPDAAHGRSAIFRSSSSKKPEEAKKPEKAL